MTDRELMQQALDALETKGEHHPRVYQAIAALREGLAQPKQEHTGFIDSKLNPIKRQWIGLDDEEYQTILGQLGDGGLLAFYILIESKLKEKNT